MECSCDIGGYDAEGYSCSERILKAGKEYKCYECNDVIKKGVRYCYYSVFGEGSILNFKVCLTCQSIIRNFFRSWQFGNTRDDLWCFLDESFSEDLPSNCISKLTPEAKDIVCGMLQKYQEK